MNDFVKTLFNNNQIGVYVNDTQKINNDIDAINLWLFEFKQSTNTLTSYRQSAERFYLWLQHKSMKLSDVTRETVLEYQEFLENPHPYDIWCGPSKPREDKDWKPFIKGLSANSVRLNLQILGSLYHYLILNQYLNSNPWRLIKKRNLQKTQIEKFLTHSNWEILKNFTCNLPQNTLEEKGYYHRARWILFVLYYTACRRSEAVNASMSSFQFKRGLWWFCLIGKGNKYAEIPVVNELLQELSLYRVSIGLSSYPSASEQNIPLIANSYGKRMSDSMLYKTIKQLAFSCANHIRDINPNAAYAIENMSTHWLRHTSATHQVDSGLDIRIVKDNLRHSMLETTMRYQHTNQDERHQQTQEKFGTKTNK